jgi:hypothetical protein
VAWTYKVSTMYGTAAGQVIQVFGQLIFSGSYATGGDAGGTFDFTQTNTLNMPNYLEVNALHATRAPLTYQVQIDAGFFGFVVYAAATSATNFKIKIVNSTTGAELGAGAYPGALTGAGLSHTLLLTYKQLI